MALPLELLMRICDVVAHKSDKETLLACSLVCSALTSHCQSHLFAKVTWDTNYLPSLKLLQNALEGNPHLGTYVKSLSVNIGSPDHHPLLRLVLSMCTRVVTLALKASDPRMVWTTALSEDTRSAVERILASPGLKELTVVGFQPPISTFFSLSSNSSLSCLGFHFDPASNPSVQLPEPKELGKGSPIVLHELAVTPASALPCLLEAKLENGQPVFDLSQLRRFAILYYADRYFEIIHQGVEYLECQWTEDNEGLVLMVLDRWSSIGNIFTRHQLLPFFSTLRHIKATLINDHDPIQPLSASFRGLIPGLRDHFPAQNVLEHVKITLFMDTYGDWSIEEDEWIPLISTFSTRSFPCLKTVHVIFDVDGWRPGDQASLVEAIDTLSFDHLSDPNFDFTLSACWS